MKSVNPWGILIVAIAFMQIIAVQHFYISSLSSELRFTEKAKDISDDLINELMYTIENLKIEKESQDTRKFVAGIVEAIKNKDYYSAVWHEGYNRGSIVAEYTKEARNSQEEESNGSAGLLP